MTPAPPASAPPAAGRRGGGRGRGRGRERRAEGDAPVGPRAAKLREKPTSSRRGGRGAAAAKPRAARGAKGGGGPAQQRKLLVRNIPHDVDEQRAREVLEPFGVASDALWRFVPGKTRGKNRAPTPARAYLDVKRAPELAKTLIVALHGQAWPPVKDGEQRSQPQPGQLVLDVALAPYQKIPREKQRKDAKVGTIDRDPEYLAFLEELNKPKEKLPSADVVADSAENEQADKPVAALVKYLNERKSRDRGKAKASKTDKSSRRQGARKKEKGAGKEKPKKERQKKKVEAAGPVSGVDIQGVESGKPKKARAVKGSSKKEAYVKKEAPPMQPGMLRIMTPKDTNGVAVAADGGDGAAPSEKLRGQKSARGRSRKDGKGPKGPDAPSDSTSTGGKSTDASKPPRPRRDSRAGGRGGGDGVGKGEKKKRTPKESASSSV